MVSRAMFVVAALFLVLPRNGDCGLCLLDVCNWLEWESWSACSMSCGGGTHRRKRSACCLPGETYDECLSTCGLDRKDNSQSQPCNKICFNGGTWSGGRCHCTSGYGAVCCDNDVNECITGRSNCDINAVCTNTPGSFTCTCSPGFTGNGKVCSDINECTQGTHNCHTNAVCRNNDGAFDCSCSDGFNGDGLSCSDIDECITGGSNCHINAFCTNSPGSFTCTCSPGYTGNGIVCRDINECTQGTHNCHTNAVCRNNDGAFNCSCSDGFNGDGVSCSDMDECTTGRSNCHTNAMCTNIPGSFACTCRIGYTGNGIIDCNINTGTTDTLDIVPIVISSSVVVVVVIVCLVVVVVVVMLRKSSRSENNAGQDRYVYNTGQTRVNFAMDRDEDTVSTGQYDDINIMSSDPDQNIGNTQRMHVVDGRNNSLNQAIRDMDIQSPYIQLHSGNQDDLDTESNYMYVRHLNE